MQIDTRRPEMAAFLTNAAQLAYLMGPSWMRWTYSSPCTSCQVCHSQTCITLFKCCTRMGRRSIWTVPRKGFPGRHKVCSLVVGSNYCVALDCNRPWNQSCRLYAILFLYIDWAGTYQDATFVQKMASAPDGCRAPDPYSATRNRYVVLKSPKLSLPAHSQDDMIRYHLGNGRTVIMKGNSKMEGPRKFDHEEIGAYVGSLSHIVQWQGLYNFHKWSWPVIGVHSWDAHFQTPLFVHRNLVDPPATTGLKSTVAPHWSSLLTWVMIQTSVGICWTWNPF